MFNKLSISFVALSVFATFAPVMGAPAILSRQGGSNNRVQTNYYENAIEAQLLNAQYDKLKANDSCGKGDTNACINGGWAQCNHGKWVVQKCPATTECVVWPQYAALRGTSIGCFTASEIVPKFEAAGLRGSRPDGRAANPPAPAPAPAPVNEDDDLPECDDDDDLEGRAFAEDDDYEYFYRRQLDDDGPLAPSGTIATNPPLITPTPTGAPVSSSAAPAVTPAPSAPAFSSAATGLSSSSSSEDILSASTQVIGFGNSRITLVHVVSTVTVTATPSGCTAASASGIASASSSSIPAAATTSASVTRTIPLTTAIVTETQVVTTTVVSGAVAPTEPAATPRPYFDFGN